MHSRIAWLAAATHIVATIASLTLLRGGLPGIPDEARAAWLRAHGAAWTAGWLSWHLAVLSLIALLVVLAMRFPDALSITGVAFTVVGAGIDLSTQSRYIAVLPTLDGAAFTALDHELEVLTGYAANGLYTLGIVLIVIAGRRVLPRSVVLLTWPVALSGLGLSVAALLHNWRLGFVTAGVLFPVFTLWTVLVALWLRKSE